MDPRVVEQKLETLRYCVNRVNQRCSATAEELARDPDTQDIIALNLSRAVHNYERINWDITHAVCSRHRDDFRAFARVVSDRT
ncbi:MULTISPECIES: hypothetical protein [unclassified Thioalkalivibrio]|uniref:hypothetical protein n=1 Tax=unclassified Thioalkalivibrio TaxID=2621013 RepID=UPI0003807D8B|nr:MULTISPECIES: hypothetical protein [unclassified Thioalkalivibrio]